MLQPSGSAPGPLLTDVTGDGPIDAVVVADCSAGWVSWPLHLLLYGPGPGPGLLGSVDLAMMSNSEHADVQGLDADGSCVTVTWAGYDGAGGDSLIFTGWLRYNGSELRLSVGD